MRVPVSFQIDECTLEYLDTVARDIGRDRSFVIRTFLDDAREKQRLIEVATVVKEDPAA